MTSTAPESPEVVGARARERVARHYYARRPVVRSVIVVSPSAICADQTPAMMPPPPQRYVPVSLARAPWVTFEEAIAEPRAELLAGMRRAWAASVAGVAPCEETEGAHYSGREPVQLDDVDDYVSGAR